MSLQFYDDTVLKYFKNDFSTLDNASNDKEIEDISKNIFNNVSPEQVERLKKIKKWRFQLKKLQETPLIKQRTQEWYELRKERLTASDLYDAIKEGISQLQLAKKKANIIADNTNYNMIPPLKWGTMFEPMASRCYSQAYNDILIHDFGLVCDENNEHFGASPDGINDLGIMIEIKCPYSREIIDGVIPTKYKMQIQGQLAVCSLEECDYIECEFKILEDENDYIQSIDSNKRVNHGIIAEYFIDNKEYSYLYSIPYASPIECIQDICNQVKEKKGCPKYIYWYLSKINVQKVNFDINEWCEINKKICLFWNKVNEYRSLSPEAKAELSKPKSKKKIQFIEDE